MHSEALGGASVSLTPCFSITWGTSAGVLSVLEVGGFVEGHSSNSLSTEQTVGGRREQRLP